MRTRLTLSVAALAVFISCVRESGPSAPERPASVWNVDAYRNGRQGFSFLPPLAPSATLSGAFDPSFLPFLEVQVCAWEAESCSDSPVERFSSTIGKGAERIRLGDDGVHYFVNWRSYESALVPGMLYRIRVVAGPAELGYTTITLTTDGILRDAATGSTVVERGRTLSIRFAVQDNVTGLAVVEPGGADRVASGDGRLRVDFPPGAVTQPSIVSVDGVTLPPTVADPLFTPAGPAYAIVMEGGSLTGPVTLHLRVPIDETTGFIEGTAIEPRHGLAVFWSDARQAWVSPLQAYDDATQEVSVLADHFSIWWYMGPSTGAAPREITWYRRNMPPINPDGMTDNDVDHELRYAVGQWGAELRSVGIRFRNVAVEENADIVFEFGSLGIVSTVLDWFSKGLTLGMASYLKPRTITFNDAVDWRPRSSGSEYSLAEVALHELGHGLGVNHHCFRCDTPPIMASLADGDQDLVLGTDDQLAIKARYRTSDPVPIPEIDGIMESAWTLDDTFFEVGSLGNGSFLGLIRVEDDYVRVLATYPGVLAGSDDVLVVFVLIDQNGDGIWSTNEDYFRFATGPRYVGNYSVEGGFFDGHQTSAYEQVMGVGDTWDGGTIDGIGVIDPGAASLLEFAHPVNSNDDSYDASLSQGQTVNLLMRVEVYENETTLTLARSSGWRPVRIGDTAIPPVSAASTAQARVPREPPTVTLP